MVLNEARTKERPYKKHVSNTYNILNMYINWLNWVLEFCIFVTFLQLFCEWPCELYNLALGLQCLQVLYELWVQKCAKSVLVAKWRISYVNLSPQIIFTYIYICTYVIHMLYIIRHCNSPMWDQSALKTSVSKISIFCQKDLKIFYFVTLMGCQK